MTPTLQVLCVCVFLHRILILAFQLAEADWINGSPEPSLRLAAWCVE